MVFVLTNFSPCF